MVAVANYADAVIACAELAGRAGAREFEMAWDCPHVPDEPEAGPDGWVVRDGHNCHQVTWAAHATFKGARIQTAGHQTPTAAAMDLAERLLTDAICRCREPVALSDERPGCRWRLVGHRWEPGCDVPPVTVHGDRGDLEAMQAALDAAPANRAQRRAARKRGGRRG